MRRTLILLPILVIALSVCTFGQIIDPNVGVFDPSAACAPTCGVHPNPIPLTEFGVWNFGGAGAPLPWHIIFAVPDNTGGAPTLSSDPSSPDSFTATGPTDAGAYLPTSSQTLYEFAGPSTTLTSAEIGAANNSMNTSNMFVGSTPSSFEVYVFSMDPALPSQVAELFDTNIVAGTFVAVLGADRTGPNSQVFSTPFTTAGLGGSSSSSSSSSSSGPGSGPASGPIIPEPNSLVLLGSALVAITTGLRKKLIRS